MGGDELGKLLENRKSGMFLLCVFALYCNACVACFCISVCLLMLLLLGGCRGRHFPSFLKEMHIPMCLSLTLVVLLLLHSEGVYGLY